MVIVTQVLGHLQVTTTKLIPTCDSGGTNCENITLNITTTGDTNDYTFNIGTTADADGSSIAFTVTGDNNIINSTPSVKVRH